VRGHFSGQCFVPSSLLRPRSALVQPCPLPWQQLADDGRGQQRTWRPVPLARSGVLSQQPGRRQVTQPQTHLFEAQPSNFRLALAAEHDVSHMTVQRAIDTLMEGGLLYSHPGLGVFVRQ
jgi:Bacterial regulatory proteins, gntR family